MRKGRVMEINPDSPIIAALRDSVAANPDSADARSVAAMLYQTALMESGFEVEDPKVCKVITVCVLLCSFLHCALVLCVDCYNRWAGVTV
jgi:HSP90 family molecular chaperone